MQAEQLREQLLMLSGIGRPTRTEQQNGSDVQVEDWNEERTASTIKSILDENNRLEKELATTKERYINDFLKPVSNNSESSPIPQQTEKKKILIEDYINIPK